MSQHSHIYLLLDPPAASQHLSNVTAFIHISASNNTAGRRRGAETLGGGRTQARSLGKGDEPDLKLRHKAILVWA